MVFRRSLLCLAIGTAFPLHVCADSHAANDTAQENEDAVEFNEQFLLSRSTNIDVSRFAHGNPVAPGTYRTRVNLNGTLKSTVDIILR